MTGAEVSHLTFAAELATFLVSVAGVAAAIRRDLLSTSARARWLLAAGFAALATAAFVRGALLDPDPESAPAAALRLAGGVLLLASLPAWRGRRSRLPFLAALVAFAAGGVAVWAGRVRLGDVLALVGAAALAVVLLSSSRRSIAARFSVLSALLVLLVVMAVAVTTSLVVTGDVEEAAAARYEARAAVEADGVVEAARTGLGPARVVAGVLASERAGSLERADGAEGAEADAEAASLTAALEELTDADLLDLEDPVVLLSASGRPIAAVPSSLSTPMRVAVAGDPIVVEARGDGAHRQGVSVLGEEAFALAVAPVVARPSDRPETTVGFVVVARRVDDRYLRVLGDGGEDLTFAVWTRTRPVARSGPGAVDSVEADDVAEAIAAGETVSVRHGDAFAAIAPVEGSDGQPVLAVVVAASGDAVAATERDLFRALFVVALLGSLVAVVVASMFGDRLGRRLGLLTGAARALERGQLDPGVVEPVRSDDEVGGLARSFAAMARALSTMTGELRSVAADEAALRTRLQAVISGMSEALVALDHDGRIIELNAAAEDLLEVTRRGAIGRHGSELVRWRLHDGSAAPMADGDLLDGQPMAADLAVGDGATPIVVTSATLLDEAGEEAGAVLVLRDVRGEREVEDLKSSILANISHELRTPLTPIKGYAALLRDRRLDEDRTRSVAEQIVDAVDRLERVVQQLVTFATLSAGSLQPERASVGLVDLAAGLRARVEDRVAPPHRLVLSLDLGPGDGDDAGGDAGGGEPTVEVDEALLGLAVDELVDNAVKYSPDGGEVEVRIGLDRGRLRVEVVDEGEGIDAELLERIADPFVQADGTATRRFGGLGLGVPCADRIARAHGGTLGFAPVAGRGTVATLLVPATAGGVVDPRA